MATYAGMHCTIEQIKGTKALLSWYRSFLKSDKTLARIPGDEFRDTMNKAQAKRRLHSMIEGAINRKARLILPPKAEYDQQTRYYRDQRALHDKLRQRVRVYQFETRPVKQRFSYLLSSYQD